MSIQGTAANLQNARKEILKKFSKKVNRKRLMSVDRAVINASVLNKLHYPSETCPKYILLIIFKIPRWRHIKIF